MRKSPILARSAIVLPLGIAGAACGGSENPTDSADAAITVESADVPGTDEASVDPPTGSAPTTTA